MSESKITKIYSGSHLYQKIRYPKYEMMMVINQIVFRVQFHLDGNAMQEIAELWVHAVIPLLNQLAVNNQTQVMEYSM